MLAVLICTVLGGKRPAQDGFPRVAGVSWYHGAVVGSARQLQNTLRKGTHPRRASEREYPGTVCTEWCFSTCNEVRQEGKDVHMECGACSGSEYECQPGKPGFPEHYCDTHGPEDSSCCKLGDRDEQQECLAEDPPQYIEYSEEHPFEGGHGERPQAERSC